MKIAFIGGRDIHKLGGIENYMYNLATQLVKMGHEPIVLCESDHNGEEWLNGFRVIHQKSIKNGFLCKPWLSVKATLKVIKNLKGCDVIHYNAWGPSLACPIASVLGQKSLMQGHGLEWQRSKYSRTQQRIMKFMEWLTAHINRNLIMCSDDQTRYFLKHYGRKTTTIPTAINLPPNQESLNSDILKRFNLDSGKYFLFLARLVKDKNPDYLIKAYNNLGNCGYKLVIAGNNPADGPYVASLHRLAGNNQNIVFTDAVYGEDKETLLYNSFAFCIPSTIEGLSISLLEAMAHRIRIVASKIPANKEVLGDDKAYWCEAEDVKSLASALSEAISDKQGSDKISYNYSLVASNYTWETVAYKYIKYLETII